MLILVLDQKVVWGTILDNLTQKTTVLLFFGQTPLRNNITMVTIKIPDDQKLFEIVCYMLIRKSPKFQLPTANGF